MPLKIQKPEIKTDVDNFIKGAKAEAPVREELSGQKEKTFLLRLPRSLWKKAKQKAADSTNDISLHDYILEAIEEKNNN